jgi:hypothetical protein
LVILWNDPKVVLEKRSAKRSQGIARRDRTSQATLLLVREMP